jgi:hypothetical protein
MKTYPPEADEDYEGNKGCILLVITSLASFGAIAIAIAVGYLVNELIKLIS